MEVSKSLCQKRKEDVKTFYSFNFFFIYFVFAIYSIFYNTLTD